MTTLPSNFTDKVEYGTDCHIWTGAVNSKGYACFGVNGVSQLAHRVAYETLVGPIPDGAVLDHLCRVRNCVNVDHVELVTVAENNRRGLVSAGYVMGGECFAGHPLTESNVYRRKRNGGVECRTCRAAQRAHRTAADRQARALELVR